MTMMQEIEEVQLPDELNLLDRCDMCNAQAFIRATSENSAKSLYFCGHHGNKYFSELFNQGFIIHDETYKINAKSESSA